MHEHLQFTPAQDHIAVAGLRLLETAQVQVAAPGVEPGPSGLPALVIEARVADAGLAQIIHGGPDKVAQHVGILLHAAPGISKVSGI